MKRYFIRLCYERFRPQFEWECFGSMEKNIHQEVLLLDIERISNLEDYFRDYIRGVDDLAEKELPFKVEIINFNLV